jgi:hypothetical protein
VIFRDTGPLLRDLLVKKPRIAVRDDASFTTEWMKLAGVRGKIKLKGTINSERVKGTLRLTIRIKGLGRCTRQDRFRVKVQARPNPG